VRCLQRKPCDAQSERCARANLPLTEARCAVVAAGAAILNLTDVGNQLETATTRCAFDDRRVGDNYRAVTTEG